MHRNVDRRDFLKTAGTAGLALAAAPWFSGIARGGENRKPNILWILADDLGYGDLGCYGCKDIPTPNIDALAASGTRFTQYYATAVCTPTRTCLLTGRYAQRFGGVEHALMGAGGLSPQAVTAAELFKSADYQTGLIGKWHLGYKGDMLPTRQGFGEFFGHRGGKIDYFKHTDTTQGNGHDLWEGETEVQREGYATDLFADRAVKFLRDHAAQPFFLYLAFNAPHYASIDKDITQQLQAPEEYLKRFVKTGKDGTKRERYAAMVSCLDDAVGKVVGELKNLGLEDNTLVIFMSDNGGTPQSGGSNGVLRGNKGGIYEGGIRVPMVARWNGIIPKGTVSDEAAHVVDLLPTALAAAGVKPSAELALDGLDILPVLQVKARIPERPLFWRHGNAAVRRGKWKLIQKSAKDKDAELFDLETDPGEKKSLDAENPKVVAELQAALDQWLASLPGK